MVALCFDLTQNTIINENECKCHDTHMYSLYTTLRKKERKYRLTSMDYIVNMEVNSADICTLFYTYLLLLPS